MRAPLDATVAVQVSQPLGEDPRLARASRRDHPRRPGPVAHCGELIGGQIGARIDRLGSRHEEAAVDGLAVDDGEPAHVVGRPGLPRATVDPDRSSVAKGDVRRSRRRRGRRIVQTCRLHPPPPDGFARPGVVGVRPRQEVEAVVPRFGVGGERPRLGLDRLGVTEAGRVDVQLDDDLLSSSPREVQPLNRAGRIGQYTLVDGDDIGGCPRCRDDTSDVDDDAAPEHRRPRHNHCLNLRSRSFCIQVGRPTRR